jgi:hypothetical protein
MKLMSFLAAFNDTIKGMVPQIIEWLKDSDSDVRWAGATAVEILAEQRT